MKGAQKASAQGLLVSAGTPGGVAGIPAVVSAPSAPQPAALAQAGESLKHSAEKVGHWADQTVTQIQNYLGFESNKAKAPPVAKSAQGNAGSDASTQAGNGKAQDLERINQGKWPEHISDDPFSRYREIEISFKKKSLLRRKLKKVVDLNELSPWGARGLLRDLKKGAIVGASAGLVSRGTPSISEFMLGSSYPSREVMPLSELEKVLQSAKTQKHLDQERIRILVGVLQRSPPGRELLEQANIRKIKFTNQLHHSIANFSPVTRDIYLMRHLPLRRMVVALGEELSHAKDMPEKLPEEEARILKKNNADFGEARAKIENLRVMDSLIAKGYPIDFSHDEHYEALIRLREEMIAKHMSEHQGATRIQAEDAIQPSLLGAFARELERQGYGIPSFR